MPVLNAKEKGLIITGILDGQGGLTSGLEAPESWERKKPRNTQEIDDIVAEYTRTGPAGSDVSMWRWPRRNQARSAG